MHHKLVSFFLHIPIQSPQLPMPDLGLGVFWVLSVFGFELGDLAESALHSRLAVEVFGELGEGRGTRRGKSLRSVMAIKIK